jgi:pimeloyl-ACP methyl ester carboxylesterase
MPGNFAFFWKGMADDIREQYGEQSEGDNSNRYKRWYIGGHSLGGVVAEMLTEEESWDGLILLAAYPTGAVNEPLLTIYGSEDGVLNMEKYADAETSGYWPDDTTEVVIEGGNHAGFGDYGDQKGDGTASITPAEQQEITAEAISKFIAKR